MICLVYEQCPDAPALCHIKCLIPCRHYENCFVSGIGGN